MIEALIDYIRNRGYMVEVWPGALRIFTIVENWECGYTFRISREQVDQAHKEVLFLQADQHMEEIRQMIIEGKPKA